MLIIKILFGLANIMLVGILVTMIAAVLFVPKTFLSGVEKHGGASSRKNVAIFLFAYCLLMLQSQTGIVFDILNPGRQYPILIRLPVQLVGHALMFYSFIAPFKALIRLSKVAQRHPGQLRETEDS